ncbi:AhpD-like protein [Rhodocollybia butyracea]|uniref:AhpD-like protein n=1 Tax=Rhodocollybia butyracea TaxID=206335 RepID=A0A9P5UAC1_9AGAR|nr:AhpD-like protein [Rhodocollybia butyracea]
MSFKPNTALLSRLKSIYPTTNDNPWYIVSAVAFSASNEPQAVPEVFRHALAETGSGEEHNPEKLRIARRLREALFKSGLTCGYPKAINSLAALHEATPPELQDTKTMRDVHTSMEDHDRNGRAFFRETYGDTADDVQKLLDTIYPDMGFFSNTIGYGLTYSFSSILSPLETSYVLVASLIANDTPRQINWHLDGARRNGATLEQVRAVRQMAIEAAAACGIKWRDGVPEVVDKDT